MLSKPNIRKLVGRHRRDAEVLFLNRRYAGSVYLQGYAVELVLKYSVCIVLKFGSGYPESQSEYYRYAHGSKRFLGTEIKKASDLKIHNLDGLLFFSGQQVSIQTGFLLEWRVVRKWTSGQRYNHMTVRRETAEQYLIAARRIIDHLM